MARCINSTLSSMAIILFTYWTFPFVAAYIVAAKLWRRLTKSSASSSAHDNIGKTAIVTGGKMTKALMVARQLKQAGCRVVLVETHKYWMVASRSASCVDRFVTVPVPEKDEHNYLSALKQLAYEEQADLFVPVSSPVASTYDARVSRVLPPGCRTLSCGEVWTAALDDKVTFNELAVQAGLTVPDTRRMTNKEAIHAFNAELLEQGEGATKYVLKNLAYDSMRRLDLFALPCEPAELSAYVADIEITAAQPWVVQEFVKGTEYSSCAIAHEGALTMFTDNVASISCFNYKHAGERKLRNWVETFCRHHKISGVVCIDFFIDAKGTPLAIECNPRFSSNITNFYNHPTIGRAYLEPETCVESRVVETPLPSHLETNWIACDVFYALTKPSRTLAQRVTDVYDAFFHKKDAYFDIDDPLPFLALYFVHIPTLLARNVWKGNRWAKIDLCIGKLTEENGD